MGILDFFKRKEPIEGYFKSLTAYAPAFSTFEGGVYEMELTRAAINAIAVHCSKLKPEVSGAAYESMAKIWQYRMNSVMDTSKFLSRVATILFTTTTAFIIPIYDESDRVKGFWPVNPQSSEVVEDDRGDLWVRFSLSNGRKGAELLTRVGILTRHQLKDDFFGDGTGAMRSTLSVLNAQSEGMRHAIEETAAIRFIARANGTIRPDDLKKERDAFAKMNLSTENTSGVMIFDQKYQDVRQVEVKPWLIDSEQMNSIKNTVYSYFGVNEDILQNKATEDVANAFYEGVIEPFALQLGLVLTNLIYTDKEIAHGNEIMFSSNRLQYASNKTKLLIATQGFDRGHFTLNQIMEIWNQPSLGEEGDKRYIRREYIELNELGKVQVEVNDEET